MHCERDEFLEALRKNDLPGNTQYFCKADSIDDAKGIMEEIYTENLRE